MTTTNTSPAQTLRAALKAEGFNARCVTIRQSHSSLHVTIRDASASLSKVKAIADKFSVVRHCEATGEILCGGNTFVNVAYSDDLVAPAKAAILVVLDPAPPDQWVDSPWRLPREEGVSAVRRDLPRGGAHRRPRL